MEDQVLCWGVVRNVVNRPYRESQVIENLILNIGLILNLVGKNKSL